MIETGQQAPDFSLPDQDGNPVALTDFRGKPVVLYLYPKADHAGLLKT
jgi:peroxiredoxin Q/BCP